MFEREPRTANCEPRTANLAPNPNLNTNEERRTGKRERTRPASWRRASSTSSHLENIFVKLEVTDRTDARRGAAPRPRSFRL